MSNFKIILLFFLLQICNLNAYNTSINNLEIQQFLYWLNDEDTEGLLELLQEYMDHPIPINQLSYEELQQFILFTPRQALHVHQYKKKYGAIRSFNELKIISGFSEEYAEWVAQFINFNSEIIYHEFQFKSYQRWGGLIEKRAGYMPEYPNPYLGNRWRWNSRQYGSLKNSKYQIDFGLITSKAPGETLFYQHQFQHQSGYLSIYFPNKIISKIIMGSHRIGFGKGLLYNQAFPSNLNFITNTHIQSIHLRVNRSVDNYLNTKGIGIEGNWRSWSWVHSYSKQYLHGIWDNTYFTPQRSGYFNTTTQLNRRNAAFRLLNTSILKYHYNGLKLQATQQNHVLNNQFIEQNLSVYGAYFGENWGIDTEIALKQSKQWATQQELFFNLTNGQQFKLLHHYYHPNYDSYLANGYSTLGGITNEHAITLIWQSQINQWQLNLIQAFTQFPKSRNNWNRNTFRNQHLIELSRYLNQQHIYIRWRQDWSNTKQNDTYWTIMQDYSKAQLRIHFKHFLKSWTYQNRLEFSFYGRNSKETAWLNYHELNYRTQKSQLKLRWNIFDISSHNNRIYVYRPNVSYAMGMHFYNQKGHAFAAIVKHKIGRFTFENSWHLQWYSTIQSQGSGRDFLNGNQQSLVDIQVIYHFKQKNTP